MQKMDFYGYISPRCVYRESVSSENLAEADGQESVTDAIARQKSRNAGTGDGRMYPETTLDSPRYTPINRS